MVVPGSSSHDNAGAEVRTTRSLPDSSSNSMWGLVGLVTPDECVSAGLSSSTRSVDGQSVQVQAV